MTSSSHYPVVSFPLKIFSLHASGQIPSPRRGEGKGEGRRIVAFLFIPLILTFSPGGEKEPAGAISVSDQLLKLCDLCMGTCSSINKLLKDLREQITRRAQSYLSA